MGRKILIIDDDPDFHGLLRVALSKAGHTVMSAMDAMQGPMVARQSSPDLILLDFSMPGGGGAAVYRRLRQLTTTLHIPIVICSAKPRSEIEKELPEAAGETILTKPAKPDAVLAAVKEVLGD